jgi:hypothetical protein
MMSKCYDNNYCSYYIINWRSNYPCYISNLRNHICYLSNVIIFCNGKVGPDIDPGLLSPFVLITRGFLFRISATLCTITRSWPSGLLNTIMSPTLVFSNGNFNNCLMSWELVLIPRISFLGKTL